MVDALTMEVSDSSDARQFFQFLDGTDADDLNRQQSEPVAHIVKIGHLLHIFTSPEGDGCPPITVP